MYHIGSCSCADPQCRITGCKAQKQGHTYLNFPPIGPDPWQILYNTDKGRIAELDDVNRELLLDAQMLRQQNEELRAENSRLKSGREEDMLEAQHLANYAAEAWDNFLKRHEEELVNLRKISNQRKKEVAKLNQELAEQQEFARTYKEWWQQSEANESHLQNKLDKAKWTEDSLRFEIECLRESILKSETELSEYRKREQHPMLEVRQAHQEADQWQHRYEEAQERLEAVTKVLNVVQDNLDKAVDVASYGTEARAQR